MILPTVAFTSIPLVYSIRDLLEYKMNLVLLKTNSKQTRKGKESTNTFTFPHLLLSLTHSSRQHRSPARHQHLQSQHSHQGAHCNQSNIFFFLPTNFLSLNDLDYFSRIRLKKCPNKRSSIHSLMEGLMVQRCLRLSCLRMKLTVSQSSDDSPL